jgi:hypothetical protein
MYGVPAQMCAVMLHPKSDEWICFLPCTSLALSRQSSTCLCQACSAWRSCDFASALSQQNSCSAILEPRKSGGYKFEPNPSQKQQLMLENDIKFKKLTK